MRSVIAWIITFVCLPKKFKRWSFDQRFRYSQRLWREVDSTIKIALFITLVFLTAVFLFSFTPVCVGDDNCKATGYSYFATSTPNEVGDALAGLAGSLAFLWLITTVFLQGKELREQRKELRLSRVAQQDQVKAFDEQRFEALFGELFSNMSIVVANLESPENDKFTGRKVVNAFVYFLEQDLNQARMEAGFDRNLTAENIRRIYEKVWKNFEGELGLYLRFLYNFYRVIDESKHARLYHHRLVRSLLNKDELTLIFYNCFSKRGENFLKYTKKYEILDNLPDKWVGLHDEQLFHELTERVWQEREWT